MLQSAIGAPYTADDRLSLTELGVGEKIRALNLDPKGSFCTGKTWGCTDHRSTEGRHFADFTQMVVWSSSNTTDQTVCYTPAVFYPSRAYKSQRWACWSKLQEESLIHEFKMQTQKLALSLLEWTHCGSDNGPLFTSIGSFWRAFIYLNFLLFCVYRQKRLNRVLLYS